MFPQEPARDTVGGGLLVLTVAMLLVGEGQKVYLLGLVRNPLFPSLGPAPPMAESDGGGGSSCLHVYSQLLLIGVFIHDSLVFYFSQLIKLHFGSMSDAFSLVSEFFLCVAEYSGSYVEENQIALHKCSISLIIFPQAFSGTFVIYI